MVYSWLSPWFWLAAMVFGLGFAISCYLPGSWVIHRFKRPPLEHIVLSTVLGIVLWGIQGYIFGYLHLRWLSFGYVAAFLWLSFPYLKHEVHRWHHLLHRFQSLDRADLPLVAMVGVGAATQLIQVIGSGLRYSSGIAFFRVNAYDGMLHLSFIEALIRQFPPTQPGASGFPLTNYHYWSDLVMAELARVWSLPVSHSFFQFWPVVLTTFTVLSVYVLIRTWGGSRITAGWVLFFLLFGADSAYLIALLLHQHWGFQVAAIDNGATQFLNMPHSFAKMIFLTGVIPLSHWLKTRDHTWGALTCALLAPVVGFKVYFGMFAGLGMALVMIWMTVTSWLQHLHHQAVIPALGLTLLKQKWLIGIALGYAITTLIIFLPPNQHAGGLFWSPLEWPKLFLSHNHLNFQEWWLRKQVYEQAGSWKGILAMDALAIAICLLCVYGTRALGFLPPRKWWRRLPAGVWLFFWPATLLFTFLGLYTLQTSGLFNVFNFFAVACVPLALFTGLWVADWFQTRRWWAMVLAIITVLLPLPRIGYHAYQAWAEQLTFKYDQLYTPAELQALEYLRYHTPQESLIQSHPKNYLDANTPYVSYFSNRQTFLTGVGMMRSHNQPIEHRVAEVAEMFASTSSLDFTNRLKQHQIDYVYLKKTSEQSLPFVPEISHLQPVFENNEVVIYQPR